MKLSNLKWLLMIALFAAFTTACNDDDDDDNEPTPAPTLFAVVDGNANFSILAEALVRTELDATLNTSGTYTVFAPNDSAFADLFRALNVNNLDEVISAVGIDGLTNILLYHVAGTTLRAADLEAGYLTTSASNAGGNSLSAYISLTGGVIVNEAANVLNADITASNGVAHEIDAVLLPPTIVTLVAANPSLSSLETALTLADGDLIATLSDNSSTFTVFAPINAAFDTLVANTPGVSDLASLVTTLGTDGLADVLLYHVVGADVRAGSLSTGSVNTLLQISGTAADFFVNINNNNVTIIDDNNSSNDANVIETDVTGTNGSVHIIDQVLLPN